MVGMIQIITYMLAFYFVLKGVEILQIGLASARNDNRRMLKGIGAAAIVATVIAAFAFVGLQDKQAVSVSSQMTSATQGLF